MRLANYFRFLSDKIIWWLPFISRKNVGAIPICVGVGLILLLAYYICSYILKCSTDR